MPRHLDHLKTCTPPAGDPSRGGYDVSAWEDQDQVIRLRRFREQHPGIKIIPPGDLPQWTARRARIGAGTDFGGASMTPC